VSWRRHRVAAGETLTSIAKKYRVTPKAIADANNLEHAVALNTGEKLIIPAIQPAAENKRRMVSYRVRKGDTFLGIADRFSVEPEDLRKWNRLAANKVRRGMVLRVYTLDSTPERGARTAAKSGAKSNAKSSAKSSAKSRKKPARPAAAVAQARSSSATRD
jgi:LysM repeat protein